MENDTQTAIEEQMQEDATIGELNPKELQTVTGGLNAIAKGAIVGGVTLGSATGAATGISNRKSKDHGISAGVVAGVLGGGVGGALGAIIGQKKEKSTKIVPIIEIVEHVR